MRGCGRSQHPQGKIVSRDWVLVASVWWLNCADVEQIAQRHTGELVKKMIMELLTSLFAEGLGWKRTKKRSKNRHAPSSVSLPSQKTIIWPSGKRQRVLSHHKTSSHLKLKVGLHTLHPASLWKTSKTGRSNNKDQPVLLISPNCHFSILFKNHWFDVLYEIVNTSKLHFYLAWLITSNIRLNPPGWAQGLSGMFLWINVMACSWVSVYLTN